MNKYKFFLSLVMGLSIIPLTSASEKSIELKRGCIKNYPLVRDEIDPELLNIYHQICDRKNKKNIELKNDLSIQAAQRFQAIGKNLKALQWVEELRKQNVQRRELTDVAFLAGIGISESNLQYMRNNEMRYLNAENTYPAAKKLSDHIQISLPEPDTSNAKVVTASTVRLKQRLKSSTLSNRTVGKANSVSHPQSVNLQSRVIKTSARDTTAAKKPQSNNSITSGSSPFASFNKN